MRDLKSVVAKGSLAISKPVIIPIGLLFARNAGRYNKDLVPGLRDSSRLFFQNPRLVVGMRRTSCHNKNHHDRRSDYTPEPRTMMDNY